MYRKAIKSLFHWAFISPVKSFRRRLAEKAVENRKNKAYKLPTMHVYNEDEFL